MIIKEKLKKTSAHFNTLDQVHIDKIKLLFRKIIIIRKKYSSLLYVSPFL